MNICPICQYKVISNAKFETHKLTHEPTAVEVSEIMSEPIVPEVPIVKEPSEIVIHFTKAVEVTINGIHYDGKDIKVKDMSIASEIVRLAREAYGPTILA